MYSFFQDKTFSSRHFPQASLLATQNSFSFFELGTVNLELFPTRYSLLALLVTTLRTYSYRKASMGLFLEAFRPGTRA